MNSLSWMIYAAEALSNLGIAAAIGAVLSLVAIGVGFFVAGLSAIGAEDDFPKRVLDAVVRKWWVPVLLCIVSVVTPSSQTIYLIAASEAGETIVTSPEAKEVFEDLKAIIKSKLKEQLPKT